MTIFHNSGNRQENFKNHWEISPKKIQNFGSFSHASKHAIYSNRGKEHSRYYVCWQKALDRKDIRTLTKNKIPQKKNWPNLYEKLTAEELLKKYGEWGTRTGKRVGNKWYVRVDLDLVELPFSVKNTLDKGFNLLISRQKVIFIKTKKGYHVILLLDELPSNGVIYHTDKFGVKRKVGDILSAGRQAQELGSPHKEPMGKGKWVWQAKNIETIAEIFKKYFFSFECQKKTEINLTKLQQEIQQKEISNVNVGEVEKSSKSLKETSQNLNQNPYKFLKLENIKITSKQATKRANHYRVNYLDKYQNSGFFFMDSYFRDKKEVVQPNLVGNFLLVRGYKCQFFYGFG